MKIEDLKFNLNNDIMRYLVDTLCEKYHINDTQDIHEYPMCAGAYTDQGEWLSLENIFETIQEIDEDFEDIK